MKVFAIFLLGMGAGAIFEIIYAEIHNLITGKPFRRNHRFTVGKKLGMFTLPIWGVVALIITNYHNMIPVFIFSAVAGTVLEWLFGWFFAEAFGIKLWVYNARTSIGKYTSLYSPPYWGGAGLMFLAVAELASKI